MTFGENLKRIRKERGLSQEEVAQKLFLSRQSISKWENDSAEPGVESLKAMADLYHVSIDELVMRSEPKQENEGEIGRSEYFYLLLFRIFSAAFIRWIGNAYHLSLEFPYDLIALVVGIWLTEPAVWVGIMCLEGLNVVIGAIVLLFDDTAHSWGLITIVLNGFAMWILCWPKLRKRFSAENILRKEEEHK